MSYRGAQVLQSAKSQQPSATAGRKAWLILLVALAMTVLEGAFRKWVFPGAGAMKYTMYFSKDIVFVGLLLLPERTRRSTAMRVFEPWLLPGCVLVALGGALSSLSGFNLVGAVLTARAAIVLPLVAWLAVPRLAGLPLRWVLWLLLACTIVNFALSVEQNRLPPGHILNRYSTDEEVNIVAEKSGVRATGTFSYITGLSIMSAVGVWTGIALMSLARNHWERGAGWTTLAAGFGCGLASISRGPIFIGLAMVGGCFLLSRDWRTKLARGLAVAIFCIVIAGVLGISATFSNLHEGWQDRETKTSGETEHRVFGPIGECLGVAQVAPLGVGFGVNQAGGYYAAREYGQKFVTNDNQFPRMIMETGIVGLFGYLIIGTGAILALQAEKFTATRGLRTVLLATQLFLLAIFYTAGIFNHTGAAFAWFIFAAVLAAKE
jgi:hypothetical protein